MSTGEFPPDRRASFGSTSSSGGGVSIGGVDSSNGGISTKDDPRQQQPQQRRQHQLRQQWYNVLETLKSRASGNGDEAASDEEGERGARAPSDSVLVVRNTQLTRLSLPSQYTHSRRYGRNSPRGSAIAGADDGTAGSHQACYT